MDPVLSSLLTTNQIGSDGFNWWIGQVESTNTDDPKKSGRYRVRIVGYHLKDGQKTPTAELPWAQVMMPVTTPFSDGGVTGATVNLRQGNWVLGFFLDNDKQKPIILGSIGHTAGSTVVQNDDPNPGQPEKEFTVYTDPNINPKQHRSVDSEDGKDPETDANIDGGEPAAARSNEEDGAPAIIAALRAKHSEANPIGSKTCVTVANPKCGNESNFSKQLTNIISDMLAANQASGGQLGDFYVSKVNGFLYDKIQIARYHIGRVTRLVRSLMGRIQSEIIKKIREGIELIVKSVITVNVPLEEKEKAPKDPEKDFSEVKNNGNILKRVKKTLDEILQALGCAIEDAIDRLAQWLTDLLFNYIMDVFSEAVCFVTNLVEGIISEILSIIDGLIAQILAPIQEILSLIGGSINIVSAAINKIMSFLGINCSGPSGKCSKQTKICTDCGDDGDDDDFLDKLLATIEDGAGQTFACEESQDYLDQSDTRVIIIGGVFSEDTPEIPNGGSTPPGNINPNETTPPNFFPSPADDPATDPDIIPADTNDDDTPIFDDGIPDYTSVLPPDDGEDDPLDDTNITPGEEDTPLDPDGTPYYSVVADPTYVTEGDTITYTIRTSNVPFGTVLSYTLSGPTILPEYIVGESLTGTFVVEESTTVTEETVDEEGNVLQVDIPIGLTQVQIQIAESGVLENFTQSLVFEIDNTDAFASATIAADISGIVNPGVTNLDPLISMEVTTDKTTYTEGEDIIYTITSENIPDGSKFSYVLYGDVTASDFVQNSLSGSFTIRDNTAKITVGIVEDLEQEASENVYFKVVGYDVFTGVKIIEGIDSDGGVDDGRDVGLKRPTTKNPITDDKGTIISVPILDKGDKYNEPPFVIISGEGFGATGIALLDPEGYVSEIRVTRGGLGYKVNTAESNNVQCVIDSFTLISPGIKYTSAPDVYINGEKGIAEAEIDSRGYVTAVKILDRTKTYTATPLVKIIGGGGAGAIALPSLVCLDVTELEERGYAKIGTGRYIDCP